MDINAQAVAALKANPSGGINACTPVGQHILSMAGNVEELLGAAGSKLGWQVFDDLRGMVAIPGLPDFPCPVCKGHCQYY